MAKLNNELTWSFSRDRLFKECRRAYFYHYYASWGGWEEGAGELARKAYVLKNMRSIDAWIGDVVHQIIKWILESKIAGEDISFEAASLKAKQLLTRTWEQSRAKLWMKNVKYNLNLFEHYYNREPTREDLVPKLQKVTASIRNLYQSGLLELLSKLARESFLRIDELDSFCFENVRVFAIPDFALKHDGYILYDWKTGRPTDKDVLQLSFYTLYAAYKWQAQSGQIKIIPAYLTEENVSLKPIEALPEEAVKKYVSDSLDQMREVLSEIATNKADISFFPKTDKAWRCKNCKFKEICE
ncbi:MAG: PD-(D/E)XK nuclease family protein [Candidatus Omnitrophota bacterium]